MRIDETVYVVALNFDGFPSSGFTFGSHVKPRDLGQHLDRLALDGIKHFKVIGELTAAEARRAALTHAP